MFNVDMYVLTCLRHAKAAPAVLEVRACAPGCIDDTRNRRAKNTAPHTLDGAGASCMGPWFWAALN